MRNWRAVLIVFGFILILVTLPTEKNRKETAVKAASLTAYPTYCLGGWENPGNAAGEPNVSEGDDSFSSSNSALLDQKVAQIFCGYFQSNDKSYPPKTVTLKFSWKMVFGSQQVQPTATSSTDENIWASVINSTSTATSTPTAPIESSSTEPIIINNASSSNSLPIDVPDTETTSTLPSIEAISTDTLDSVPPAADIPTSTDATSSASSFWNFLIQKVFADSDFSSQGFLNVSYNLENGKNWQSAGQVTEANWQNFSVQIPVASWDDIEKLQVQLTPNLTVDMPTIYLDGMWLEVDYNHSILDTVKDEANAVLNAASNVGDVINEAINNVANNIEQAVSDITNPNDAKNEVVLQNPQSEAKIPKFSFAIKRSLSTETKDLPWFPVDTKKHKKIQDNPGSADVNTAGDQNSFKVEGTCGDVFYTVLLFRNSDDYLNDPSSAVLNRAYPCVNGSFSQTFSAQDFPNIADGTYYLLTADQGTQGPWKPNAPIREITIAKQIQ